MEKLVTLSLVPVCSPSFLKRHAPLNTAEQLARVVATEMALGGIWLSMPHDFSGKPPMPRRVVTFNLPRMLATSIASVSLSVSACFAAATPQSHAGPVVGVIDKHLALLSVSSRTLQSVRLHQKRDVTSTPVTPNILSRRQSEALRLIVQGRSNKEVAPALNLAEGTASTRSLHHNIIEPVTQQGNDRIPPCK